MIIETVTYYICEICGEKHRTEPAAIDCEIKCQNLKKELTERFVGKYLVFCRRLDRNEMDKQNLVEMSAKIVRLSRQEYDESGGDGCTYLIEFELAFPNGLSNKSTFRHLRPVFFSWPSEVMKKIEANLADGYFHSGNSANEAHPKMFFCSEEQVKILANVEFK